MKTKQDLALPEEQNVLSKERDVLPEEQIFSALQFITGFLRTHGKRVFQRLSSNPLRIGELKTKRASLLRRSASGDIIGRKVLKLLAEAE
jgi:hypothetical protein